MRKIACLFLILVVCGCATVQISKEVAAIEIIGGTPSRKFVKIEPVLYTSEISIQNAIKGIKLQASKVGADAIIEFTFGTDTGSSVGAAGGVLFGSSSPYPTCKGWAIKWVE